MMLQTISAFTDFGASKTNLLGWSALKPSVPNRCAAALENFRISQKRPVLNACGAFAVQQSSIREFSHHEVSSPDALAVGTYLDNWSGQADAFVQAHSSQSTWAISAGFLADLLDPRPFLLAIKRLCLQSQVSVLFVHGIDDGRQRDWTESQFLDFIRSSGFLIVQKQREDDALFVEASVTREHYCAHLIRFGYSESLVDADLLLVTTEDSSIRPTGGIGTYTSNLKRIDTRACVLFCDTNLSASPGDGRTFFPQALFDGIERDNFLDGLGLLEALYCVLYLLPALRVVESQDYQSIGFRIVQAKRVARLPPWLTVRIFLHGPTDYIKYGAQDATAMNYSPYECSLAIKDSYLLKYADECFVPSRYLGVDLLQKEFGYDVANLHVKRLPFDLALIPDPGEVNYRQVKRLVFIGKYSQLKGWPDFVNAIESLSQRGVLQDIEEVVSLGPLGPTEEDRMRIAACLPYRDLHLSHDALIQFVQAHVSDTLFVVPSRGENYPFVILEQLLMGTLLVAYNTGGAIEVVDDPDHVQRFFSDPNPSALALKIEDLLNTAPSQYSSTLNANRRRIWARQALINREWAREDPTRTLSLVIPPPLHPKQCDISIVVPVYNTPEAFIEQLLRSIEASRIRPKEVILIDDGSTPSYGETLQAKAREACSRGVPCRIHRQANRGLAGARNAGLAQSRSTYTFFIDSDDLLLRNTLEIGWMALLEDPTLVAATGFAVYFTDLDKLVHEGIQPLRSGRFWKPLGVPEARALALLENQYITANIMAKTATLRELGGWDETDRSTWEDWAFFSRLAWGGRRFSLIPAAGFFYRNTPGSMSKTYNNYFGRRRLVRNVAGMTRLDANILFSLVNYAKVAGPALSGPSLSEREAELINLIRSWAQHPILRRAMVLAYRGYGKLRRLFR